MTDAPKSTPDTTEEARARTKEESFDVYREDDDGTLDLIEQDVKVSARGEEARRQAAIVKATWGLAAVAGAVLLAVGGVRWLDCNAELMRREGTTRRARGTA